MMKKIFIAVVLIVALCSSAFAADQKEKVWASAGVKTGSVAAGVELANTGVMLSSEYSVFVVISSLTIAKVEFEVWSSDMTTRLKSQRIHLAANIPFHDWLAVEYPIAQDVIFILKNVTALTSAEIQGAISVK